MSILLVVTVPGQAAAGHERSPTPTERFASSFEAGEPQPDWTDAVETGGNGAPKTSGVDGGPSSVLAGDVTDRVAAVRASGENAQAGESARNLVDGDPASKWLTFAPTAWAEFTFDRPVAVVRYALTSADDAPERDPRAWTLSGSDDGTHWTLLHTADQRGFTARMHTRQFTVRAPRPHRHYRLDIVRNAGGGETQLADVRFAAGADPPPPPPGDMRTRVDRGPSQSPTARTHAGFTGTHALLYAGRHRTEGPAWSYNKVFDVDTRIGPDTVLSYRIFPSMPQGESGYTATHASLDLAFTDGTYLSDLRAVDQHGARLTPRGQASSKTLYVNQWNHKESRIGRVAAGKTVDRILVAYDSPAGPAAFRGWIDDVSLAPRPPAGRPAHLSDLAVTTRGTNSSGSFSRGNTFPATAVPHGFNFWTPLTDAGSTSWLYEYARRNNPRNLPTVQAFGAGHQPSPWMGDRQTFQVMPSTATGTPSVSRSARALPFRHENELARPHHYRVAFENGLTTEIAPADHAAVLRFTFPGKAASVVFDNAGNEGGLSLDPGRGIVTGFSDVRSRRSVGAGRLFVYGVFDAPVTAGGRLRGSGRDNVTGWFRFRPGADRTVVLRIATSLISLDQAKRNLALEIPPTADFDDVRARAQKAWDDILGRVEVEGATPDQLTTLYSNLYRLYLYPNAGHENTGTGTRPRHRYASPFSPPAGPDTPVRSGSKIVDGEVHVNNGFWDTYRTTWPAYALLTPRQAGRLADGFVQQFRDGGWISRWSSPGYADLMTGTSSDAAFADAHLKGVPLDAGTAYRAALRNATVVPPFPGVGRKGMETSVFRGWTDNATHEGLSWALEGYINDFALARMAEALHKRTGKERYRAEAAYFRNRSLGYVHHFDRASGFFQGRTPDGAFRLPPGAYDPRVWGHGCTETNGWNFAFHAPHDTRGLAKLYGGRAGLAKKLDAFFAAPETAEPRFAGSYGKVIHEMTEARDVRMGMYGHSNQVSHHIPYLYNAAGQPWKTQARVREVLSRLYLGSEIGQGYPGDEDNGEMSAWYLFSALGFYPLVMGGSEYTVGSPLFTRATVHLDNGRKLVVAARGNSARNRYVQSLTVNGKPWTSTSLPHALIAGGAELEFTMGPKPSRWGTGRDAGPASVTIGDAVPSPREDASRPGSRVRLAGGGPGGALVDDTSLTAAAFTSADVELPRGSRAVQYTLTSSARAAAPRGWVLKGSRDGRSWRTLDRRAGESFDWDRQTRVFDVTAPGTFRRYRLETSGGRAVTLAEVEFLAQRRHG